MPALTRADRYRNPSDRDHFLEDSPGAKRLSSPRRNPSRRLRIAPRQCPSARDPAIRSECCACATSGHVAAPPSSATNARAGEGGASCDQCAVSGSDPAFRSQSPNSYHRMGAVGFLLDQYLQGNAHSRRSSLDPISAPEGMNTAGLAESVLGHFGVELVGSEFVFPLSSSKRSGGTIRCRNPFSVHTKQCTQKYAIGRQRREIVRCHSGSFPRTSSRRSPTRSYRLQRFSGLSLSRPRKADFILELCRASSSKIRNTGSALLD
jgi:hypothetical protein